MKWAHVALLFLHGFRELVHHRVSQVGRTALHRARHVFRQFIERRAAGEMEWEGSGGLQGLRLPADGTGR